ncbi:MAG: hypothetical protein HZB18_00305 [Chloroflexi bacterium]|nr:hypothetical protein [Chloroflexota bacterium]
MKKRSFYIIFLAITAILTVTIIGFIFAKSNSIGESATDIQNHFPITALYLDGSVLRINCLDTPKCFPDIDLGNQIRIANNPDEPPLQIGFAYYGQDLTLYLLLSGGTGQYLAKVNLETGQVQILDPASFLGGLNSGFASTIQGKLILATAEGKISVVQNDFSVKTIADLKAPVFNFIEANNSKIAVISTSGVLQESSQVKMFLADINSGDIEEKMLNGPQGNNWQFVTIDQNLKHLYWLPTDSNILNVFELQIQKNILSVPISNFDALIYTTQNTRRYQYHGIWYYSRRCCQEGPYPAMMLDMSTLQPVINPEDFLKNESDETLMISSFGNNFLIGMNSRVLLVSADGTVIKTYSLPKEWIGRDYLLLEYRK